MHPLHELKMRSGTRVQGNAKICCSGLVCFTQSGKAAHALHPDSKTALGPWITFASDATLDRALVYLGADPMRRWKITRQSMRAWGQSSTHIRLLQNRKTCSGSITASAEPACPFTRGCPRSPRWFFCAWVFEEASVLFPTGRQNNSAAVAG